MTSLKLRIGWMVSFFEGMFGSMSEGCFVAKLEAGYRFNFGLEMINVSLEGEFTV
jgi:hypothetical protein